MRAFTEVQRRRLTALLALLETGAFKGHVPGDNIHEAVIEHYATTCWHWGWRHAEAELERFKNRRFQLGSAPSPKGPPPSEAVTWAKGRVALQGKWNRDLDSAVNDLVVKALQEGWTNQRLAKELKTVFPTFSKLRLENIARTETASSYNAGRMAQFGKSRLIAGYQFSAVLDARTTKICRPRNGLIMVLANTPPEVLAMNTPPLHYQCRSTLIPIDKYDLEDLVDGKESALEDYFGWVEDGPKDLADATSWKDLPQPLSGFGVPTA